MRIVESLADLQLPSDLQIGFVPTMGAFHEGHLRLMQRSKETCGYTVVSLFVNPLQFIAGEDFDRYPRDLQKDAEMARSVGVDLLFAPPVSEIYPDPVSTVISVPGISERWEGEYRPGHFDGVATVVAKLFNIVPAHVAFFGRKDFQQCAVILKMVRDLNIRTTIRIEDTVRESDGLAMSSRNRYLSDEDRKIAPTIFKILGESRERILDDESVGTVLAEGIHALETVNFVVDYLAYVDNKSLEPLSIRRTESSLICAVRLGSTRLIDNVQVS